MANSNTFEGDSFMLFGVRITPTLQSSSPSHSSSHRECTSVNTIAQGEQQQYHHALPFPNRECKRGVPWTAEEHTLFLKGLNEGCKGNWKGISKKFVKTRTPTQIASHAQKYFKRITNVNCRRLRRRHRSSVFDITTDTVNCRNEASPIGNSRAETLYASI